MFSVIPPAAEAESRSPAAAICALCASLLRAAERARSRGAENFAAGAEGPVTRDWNSQTAAPTAITRRSRRPAVMGQDEFYRWKAFGRGVRFANRRPRIFKTKALRERSSLRLTAKSQRLSGRDIAQADGSRLDLHLPFADCSGNGPRAGHRTQGLSDVTVSSRRHGKRAGRLQLFRGEPGRSPRKRSDRGVEMGN